MGYISLIGVKNDYRGQNIGKHIIYETMKIMKNSEMKKVMLEVDSDNFNAKGFYHHLGFTKVSETNNSEYLELNL